MDEELTPAEETEKDDKSISSDLIRGHINTIILRSLYDGDKYGYEIIAEIERKSHGQYTLKQPSLYSALKRLEKDGYITSYWGGSVGGGRRKYFSLTDEGKTISEQNQSEWEYSRTVIDSLISDRDFDFSNPPPSLVNMRVLKDTTSRVPSREDGDEDDFGSAYADAEERNDLQAEYEAKTAALDADRQAFEAERSAYEEERRTREEALRTEQSWRERELEAREQAIEAERRSVEALKAAEVQAQESERETAAQEEAARQRALAEENAEQLRLRSEELAQRESELAEARAHSEEQLLQSQTALNEERAKSADALREQRAVLEEERARFADVLRERDEMLEEERRAHVLALEEQESRLRREYEENMHRREQQILHRNYMELVSSPPPAQPENTGYGYYTAPPTERPESAPAPAPEPEPEPAPNEREYRSVVQRIYSPTVQNDREDEAPRAARSLDGIDFHDLEARAARDRIRITTTGSGSFEKQEERSENIVHKGKALFLSAIVVFFLCVIEGAVALAVRTQFEISIFLPYFIWCIGLAVLLITGLAYANHYGERSIRRANHALLNSIVIYVLCVIVVLIVALAARIDFASLALSSYVVVPVIFLFGIVVFGICYYLQTRPKD